MACSYLIGDLGNHRILELDSTLKWVGCKYICQKKKENEFRDTVPTGLIFQYKELSFQEHSINYFIEIMIISDVTNYGPLLYLFL